MSETAPAPGPGRDGQPLVGLLLAGGLSRRMGGGDKCLLTLAGRPMLAHAIARLAPQVGPLALNANGDPARFSAFALPVVADTVEGYAGPLAGVLAGLRWAEIHAPGARRMVSAASDTPFFPRDLAARLVAAAGGADRIVLAESGGRAHPVFGLWPVALADDLERFLVDEGGRKVLDWVGRHANARARFDNASAGGTAFDPFFNANAPEELEAAEALIGKGAA